MASAEDIFRTCGERAAEREVTFCLEPLTTQETDFIVSASEAAAMVRRVNHPGFRMIVDARAMSYEAHPMPEIVHDVAPLVRHVHLNDPNELGPGMGDLDIEPLLHALREEGYAGWLSVEPFDPTPGPERIATESLAYVRRCMERIEDHDL
jgi:sugar phosphate isomerase/epimerase